MKAITSDQQVVLAALIQLAGGNERFQQLLKSTGKPETSLADLLERLKRMREASPTQALSPAVAPITTG